MTGHFQKWPIFKNDGNIYTKKQFFNDKNTLCAKLHMDHFQKIVVNPYSAIKAQNF